VFLLFIPILWVFWLWVHAVATCFTGWLLTILCHLTDDSLETRYHMPRLSSFLRLPCYVLFCWRCFLSGTLSHRSLYGFVICLFRHITDCAVTVSWVVRTRCLCICHGDVPGPLFAPSSSNKRKIRQNDASSTRFEGRSYNVCVGGHKHNPHFPPRVRRIHCSE
jgi:hypothetical protein